LYSENQWRNDGVAAASSDGGPTGRGAPPVGPVAKRVKARGGPDLRKWRGAPDGCVTPLMKTFLSNVLGWNIWLCKFVGCDRWWVQHLCLVSVIVWIFIVTDICRLLGGLLLLCRYSICLLDINPDSNFSWHAIFCNTVCWQSNCCAILNSYKLI